MSISEMIATVIPLRIFFSSPLFLLTNGLCIIVWYSVFKREEKALVGVFFAGIICVPLFLGTWLAMGTEYFLKYWWLNIIPALTITRAGIAALDS